MTALLAIVLLGFFLGMRHATDPDHVVAVTTIVSRERTMLHAALIGALWGLGHTFTILVVGSAIILFKLTIPPRLGLSMELSVGFMLILLGVLNLTGLMRRAIEWITIRRLGPGAHSHMIFGRMMVHTHDEDGEPVFLDQPCPSGMDSAVVEKIGPVSHFAAAHGGNRARPGGFGRGGVAGPDDDPSSVVGHRISARFWTGNDCRDDADYGGDRASVSRIRCDILCD